MNHQLAANSAMHSPLSMSYTQPITVPPLWPPLKSGRKAATTTDGSQQSATRWKVGRRAMLAERRRLGDRTDRLLGHVRWCRPAKKLTIDDSYTATVVARWQTDLGVAITGDVNHGSVIFTSGAVNIGAHSAVVGDQISNGPVLSVSSLLRQVEFGVEVADLDTIEAGTIVSVGLPDRSTVEASVISLVSSAGSWTAVAQVGDTDGLTKVGVVPVTVRWTEELATDVLTVPAVALNRLDDGTYNVELLNADDTTEFVPIELGLNSGSTSADSFGPSRRNHRRRSVVSAQD